MSDQRAAFEAAILKGTSRKEATQHIRYMRELERDEQKPEEYTYHATQFAWELWQAAIAQPRKCGTWDVTFLDKPAPL